MLIFKDRILHVDFTFGADCLNCMISQCNYTSEYCNRCIYGWWGTDCQHSCPIGCIDGCDRVTGQCQLEGMLGNCISHRCANPTGFTCDWYTSCLQKYVQPSCSVVKDIMYDKCQEYLRVEPTFSPKGQVWSGYVRKCLQQTLARDLLLVDQRQPGQFNCTYVTKNFFDNHVECYQNGPVSVCDLPYDDVAKVLIHGLSILFTRSWYYPIISCEDLIKSCSAEYIEHVKSMINDVYYPEKQKTR
ncbi:hypothetical protein PPL_12415 [Heterostelium album PN500]|uniref:Uncharacterized protein n=1 Tax=Heterostelium pallidum (strain ATCC 26659 / Pp 5 / PN500) TaxID=670386 RepID=D3BMJ4_HETP5|nr:hypothetical protein PPL_12415 [Heterostelium album PN500]EFA77206.1 hypothetical protein PPL_12415 [Heterostelium album PN500]|eukprot:XP_020429335.1 hypothetical protein PPL_12415 [Heterostelium album PN500]